MQTTTITAPNTGRQLRVRAWQVEPRKLAEAVTSGQSARDISWALLSDDEAFGEMRAEQHGDEASRNFALSIFENALDFRLGSAALSYVQTALRQFGRYPKPFTLAIDRRGDIYIVGAGGRVYAW